MCDFKPGDEVVCVRSDHGREGMTFIVEAICPRGEIPAEIVELCRGRYNPLPGEVHLVRVAGLTPKPRVDPVTGTWGWGHDASRFRKVQHRDLSAWLKTSVGNTDKLDKRAPAKEGAA